MLISSLILIATVIQVNIYGSQGKPHLQVLISGTQSESHAMSTEDDPTTPKPVIDPTTLTPPATYHHHTEPPTPTPDLPTPTPDLDECKDSHPSCPSLAQAGQCSSGEENICKLSCNPTEKCCTSEQKCLGWHMWVAGKNGDLANVSRLLSAGADPQWRNPNNDMISALYVAFYYNHLDVTLLLIEHNADVNIPDRSGMTPLMWAASSGHVNMTKALINANASIDAVDDDNWTALHWAASSGNVNTTKALINANVSIDAVDDDNWTALHYAAAGNHRDVALLLIEHNADVNFSNSIGGTPLMSAALHGHVNMTKALINANASIDAVADDNETALHYAAVDNHRDVALLLLQSGAAAHIEDRTFGRTPAAWARYWDHDELADLIENYTSTNTSGQGPP